MPRWCIVALLVVLCACTALSLPPSKYRGRQAVELESIVLCVSHSLKYSDFGVFMLIMGELSLANQIY